MKQLQKRMSEQLEEIRGYIYDINTPAIASHLNGMDNWTWAWRTGIQKEIDKLSSLIDCMDTESVHQCERCGNC